jgi:two-component system, LytTR family, response regulator
MKPLTVITSREPRYAERAIAEADMNHPAKPISADSCDYPLGRIRQRRGLEQFVGSQLARQILHLFARGPKLLVGERQHRLYPLDVEQIEYIEADGNYVTIRVGAAEYVSRDSLKRLTAELADFGFVRIDRSTLLNIRAVQFAEPIGHGRLAFSLASGACLHSSRTYRDTIVRVLPWHHCRLALDSEEMDLAQAAPTLQSR